MRLKFNFRGLYNNPYLPIIIKVEYVWKNDEFVSKWVNWFHGFLIVETSFIIFHHIIQGRIMGVIAIE